MDLVGLTSYLIKSLVKDPESVSVKQFESEEDVVLIEVYGENYGESNEENGSYNAIVDDNILLIISSY